MKKHVLMMSLTTLILFGCSTSETETIQEANLKFQTTNMFQDLVANKEFRSYFNAKSTNSETARYKSNDNNGNGVMFIQNGQGGFWSIGLRNDEGIVEKVVFLGGNSSDIKVDKNGRASAHSSSNNVYCFLLDFSDFSSLRNECYDVKGHFNLKVTGTLVEEETPWGDVFYFIDRESTILHANNIRLSNETATYDEETFEFLYCNGDATIEKSLSVRLIEDSKGNRRVNEIKIE